MRWSVEEDYVIVRGRFRVVSSAPWHGGFVRAGAIANVHVPKSYDEAVPSFFRRFERRTGERSLVGLLTAVDLRAVAVRRSRYGTAIVTAGVSNAARVGTINVILVVRGRATAGGLIEAVKVVTEAKTAALRRLDVRAGRDFATGTTTDAVAIACEDRGEPWEYCGGATARGRAFGTMVGGAVLESLARGDGLRLNRPIRSRLTERGWSSERIERAVRGAPLSDRPGWEARLGIDEAVRAGRLPGRPLIGRASRKRRRSARRAPRSGPTDGRERDPAVGSR